MHTGLQRKRKGTKRFADPQEGESTDSERPRQKLRTEAAKTTKTTKIDDGYATTLQTLGKVFTSAATVLTQWPDIKWGKDVFEHVRVFKEFARDNEVEERYKRHERERQQRR